jgi:hypothetical protein
MTDEGGGQENSGRIHFFFAQVGLLKEQLQDLGFDGPQNQCDEWVISTLCRKTPVRRAMAS